MAASTTLDEAGRADRARKARAAQSTTDYHIRKLVEASLTTEQQAAVRRLLPMAEGEVEHDGGPMARAVGSALVAVTDPRDQAAATLCRRYAMLIDDAAPRAAYRDSIEAVRQALDTITVPDLVGPDYEKHWTKIADALAAHSVASDLGPKLLAALTALGLTLAGRGAKGGTDGASADRPKTEVDELRERRGTRAQRARKSGA